LRQGSENLRLPVGTEKLLCQRQPESLSQAESGVLGEECRVALPDGELAGPVTACLLTRSESHKNLKGSIGSPILCQQQYRSELWTGRASVLGLGHPGHDNSPRKWGEEIVHDCSSPRLLRA
jgi:hypothetical protein